MYKMSTNNITHYYQINWGEKNPPFIQWCLIVYNKMKSNVLAERVKSKANTYCRNTTSAVDYTLTT